MKELKITKGTWHYKQNEVDGVMQSHFLVESINKILPIAKVQSDTMSLTETEANAQLIAEAGTVANECGKTPRELLEERDELLKIVKHFGINLKMYGNKDNSKYWFDHAFKADLEYLKENFDLKIEFNNCEPTSQG